MLEVCSSYGYDIESKDEWTFTSSNKKYTTTVSFINKNIVHLDVIGIVNEDSLKEVWTLIEELINNKLKGSNYYLIHNYKKFKSASTKSRNFYIHWVNNNIDNIETIYFYNVSPYFRVLIQAGKLLSNKLENTYIFNSLDLILNGIKNNNINNPIISEVDFWEIGYQFQSPSGISYTTIKKWDYSHSSGKSRFETYLINDNIFIRRFYGKLEDGTMKEITDSFDKILIEQQLTNSKYHFFIDFSNVEEMTLSYRKQGLLWFLENKDFLLTSGFFNLTSILKVQLKIAVSLFPFTHFVKRVFVLNNIDEVFNNIENPSYHQTDKIKFSKENYSDYNRKELILEIKDLSERIDFIEDHKKEEINKLYNKLGRLTWDESYQFDEEDFQLTNTPFSDLHNAIIIVQRDIKEILEKRDSLIAKAQESEKLKTSFLANMSHEIRTPMNSIIGFTSLLLEEIKDKQQNRYLSIVNNSSKHLLSLINDILDISKLESGNFDLNYSNFIVDKLIYSIIEEQELNLTNDNLKIRFETPKEAIIFADRTRIKQIFINLISNALKFTKKGEITIGYKIIEDTIEFYVKDTGIGIDAESQKLIFDRFRQANDTISNKSEGTGLGLAITKSLIKLHKGKIWVESNVNKGASFYFNLPYIKKTNKIFEQKNTFDNKNKITQKTFLIAEDNLENFIYLEILLKPRENKILHAKTGTEVLEILNKQKIDLIFMDLQMPEMDGLTCTKKIRNRNINIPIIAQTAYAMESDKIAAFNAGCNDYIEKPIKKEKLYSTIQSLLKN